VLRFVIEPGKYILPKLKIISLAVLLLIISFIGTGFYINFNMYTDEDNNIQGITYGLGPSIGIDTIFKFIKK
jgi:hypothetical protein